MTRIVDLSHPVTNGMPVFPGDPAVDFRRVSTIKDHNYNVTAVTLGTHAGTHVDVPSHVLYEDRGVDSLSLDDMVGWAEVLNLGELPPKTAITAAHLDVFADRVAEGSRVLLRTGWSKRFGQPDFFTDFPGVSEGAALWLKSRGVRLLGIEQPSVHPTDHLEVHKALLAAGIIVIETMANLDQIEKDRVYLAALPINLVGLDGSPMRVIAIEGLQE